MDEQAVSTRSQLVAEPANAPFPAFFLTGFSLMELLVVIAITALLASISVSVLDKAKADAKQVICKSNLRELGRIWKQYTEDNDGRFPERGCGFSRGAVSWFHSIRDYYYPNLNLILCPMAMKTAAEGARNPHMAWDNTTNFGAYYKGSYGINLWVADGSTGCNAAGPNFNTYCWRTPTVKGASYAPLLLCSQWKDTQPYPTDDPPEHENDMWTPNAEEVRRACIRRHDPYHVNVLFLDFSVDKRTIKQLWRLKWHKNWPPDYPLPVWPEWMADVPDPH
jgi:prepilin-type N-terminal cleavage/methylation domain-containing protein